MYTCKLRPHHALCVRFFTGHGYSPEFAQNMAHTIARLNGGVEVQLCADADCICAACPNMQNGKCADSDKVTRYDSAVLKLCGLAPGQAISYDALRRLADECIILAGRMNEVCPDCEWRTLCLKSSEALRHQCNRL